MISFEVIDYLYEELYFNKLPKEKQIEILNQLQNEAQQGRQSHPDSTCYLPGYPGDSIYCLQPLKKQPNE